MNKRMQLETVDAKNDAMADEAKVVNGLEATLLELDDGAFSALTGAAQCGSPGLSGFNDQWGWKLSCPGYGQI
ncbi:MAG: hypothetical protein AAB668_03325 [Patescibacteria group bacterium]